MTHCRHSLFLHPRLDRPPLLVERIEPRGERERFGHRVGDQATDAERHVIETPRRVQSRTGSETEIRGDHVDQCLVADLQQGAHPCGAASGADTREALRHEHPIVGVERHDVRDRAECDEIEPVRRRRQRRVTERPMQGGHHVEGHADTGQRGRGKTRVWQIRVDDHVGRRQLGTGKVMIGDEHVDTERACRGDAGQAGDTVVDGDDQRRLLRRGERDDLRRQSVPELEAVRHQKIDIRKTPGTQAAHDERGAGRAIGVEIADHEDAAAGPAMHQQQLHRRLDAIERPHGQQAIEAEAKFAGFADAARGVGACQHRIEPGKSRRCRRVAVAAHHLEFHAPPSVTAASQVRRGRQNRSRSPRDTAIQRSFAATTQRSRRPAARAAATGAMQVRS